MPYVDGEPMLTSSLMPEDESRGHPTAGGGVTLVPLILPVSEKLSQKCLPFEFFMACCLKLLDNVESAIISSSVIISSIDSCIVPSLGDDWAVGVSDISKGNDDGPEGFRG